MAKQRGKRASEEEAEDFTVVKDEDSEGAIGLQVLSEVATRPKTICSLVISRDLKDFKFSTERYCLELDDNCNLLEAQEQFRLIVGNSDQNIEVETFCLTKGKFYFMFIYYLTIFFACVQLEHSF